MGLIKTAIVSALASDQPNNGFNGPKIPFTSQRPKSRSQDPVDSPYVADPRQQRCPQYGHEDKSRFHIDEKARRTHGASDYASGYSYRDMRSNNPYFNSGTHNTDYTVTIHNDFENSYTDTYGPPPSYESNLSRNFSPDSQPSYQRQSPYPRQGQAQARSRTIEFSPLALPQIKYGDGQPFLRGYSTELEQYGITEEQFIHVVDQINIAVIPSPENQIFQKVAGIAGWFVPGVAGIGLMAGQIGVGITAAFGHATLVMGNLSKANLEVFLPRGLEICIGKTKDLDNELRVDSSSMPSLEGSITSPASRIASYGDLIARIDFTYAPAENPGRKDPLARMGNALSNMEADKKLQKAQRGGKRQGKRMNELEESVKWLMVRRATPAALEHWRKTLDQSTAALKQE